MSFFNYGHIDFYEGVAKSGQRRTLEGGVFFKFAGSNPVPLICDAQEAKVLVTLEPEAVFS